MSANSVVLSLTLENCIKISKWKVKEGTIVSAGRVILIYTLSSGTGKPEVLKLKATAVGTVRKLLVREGDVVQPGDPLLELEKCTHPTVMKDMCAECGADLRNEETAGENAASIPMVHSIPELKVNAEQAQILGKADEERLLANRKLVLLVDLDQTLIHTTNDNIPPNLKDVYHFRLHGSRSPWHHTRLRPGTKNFLKEMSKYYELHICTFGSRMYAHMIAMFLDPDGQYFSHRILSRDECFSANSKTANLKALFPCGDNMVCIIDDREDVWNFAPNLIHVKPYHFFQHTGDINAPPGLAKRENDDKGDYDFRFLGDGKKGQSAPHLNTSAESQKEPQKDAMDLVKRKNSDSSDSKNLENAEKFIESSTVGSNICPTEVGSGEPIKPLSLEAKSNSSEVEMKESNADLKAKESPSDFEGKRNSVEQIINSAQVFDNIECNNIHSESITLSEVKLSESKVQKQDLLVVGLKDTVMEVADEVLEREKVTNSEALNTEILEKCSTESEQVEVQYQEGNGAEIGLSSVPKKDEMKENSEATINDPSKTTVDEIEVTDQDDYLLYLEEILKRIHKEFYEREATGLKPDLKEVVPAVRKKVLKGTNLVFSGLVPNNIPLEKSRAYQVAVSLGANVSQDFNKKTTHLVAVRPGTAKVNSARRMKNIFMVTADWLWVSAERWERVDEKVFPLGRNRAGTRHPPAHCGSPEHTPVAEENSTEATTSSGRNRTASGRFMDTINPLLSFSSADIADMDQEVNDIFNESESDGEGGESSIQQKRVVVPELESESDEESSPVMLPPAKSNLEEDSESSSSSADSLSGEHPHGWSKHNLKRKHGDSTLGAGTATESDGDEEADDMPSTKFRRGEALPSDLDLGENESESPGSEDPPDEMDDGDWNMMGAALEREFLS